ncbi:MAG: hypothetical protein AAB838_00415 [Patescibacteria group bacterium]
MRFLGNPRAHFTTISELMVNISAGYFALVLLFPFGNADILNVMRNLIFGLVTYFMSVKFKEVVA